MSQSGSNWQMAKVKNLAEYITVGFVGSMSSLFVEDGVPLLRGQNIHEYSLNLTNLKYISQETHTKWKKSALMPGDVVIVRVGYPGTACVIPNGIGELNAASLVIVRPDPKKLDANFLCYVINSPWGKAQVSGRLVGAAQQVFNTQTAAELEISCPPLPTQQRIAGILSAYDELIENSQKRIKILESMARTLYREWFVHFRFPGHESVPLVPSSLGDLPQGWDVLEFRHLFDIRYGKTLPKSEISDSGTYPVYGAGDVIGFYDKMLYLNKCALVTSRGNGSGTVWRTREAAFVTNNSLVILPQEDRSHWEFSFIELLLKHSNVMGARTGSAQPQVTIENLNYVRAIVPSGPLVKQFCAIASPLYEQVDLLFRQIRNIRQIRDLLLPRLLSGQIEVEAVAS